MKPKITALYTPEQTQAIDRYAIDKLGVLGTTLMSRAGHSAFDLLKERWPDAQQIVIFCGGGNNGGDGYVVAALAQEAGFKVELRYLHKPERLKGESQAAYQWSERAGVSMAPYQSGELIVGDLIVDALLGTGLSGDVHNDYYKAILEINRSNLPVMSIDIPSGLNGETGAVMGAAVEACVTITYIGIKQGMLTAAGREHCGELLFDDLGIPDEAYENVTPVSEWISFESFTQRAARSLNSHKGDFGHLLIIGGNRGMGGAIRIATEAAAYMGVGLITVATHRENITAIQVARPEVMVHAIDSVNDLEPLLQKANTIVIGPGLGKDSWAQNVLGRTLQCEIPMIIDADALNLLADRGFSLTEEQADDPLREQLNPKRWVLTPHPGEAARLLHISTDEVQSNRFDALEKLVELYDATVVLKGAGTLVSSKGIRTAICNHGNPGMASGGMGDLLAGIIGGLLAQGDELNEAARYGVTLHSAAADRYVAEHGEWGVLATDLIPTIREMLNFGDLAEDEDAV